MASSVAAAASAVARAASAVGAVPGQPPAFDTVVKDAKKTTGLFTVWQKDDKFWIELAPSDFNTPLFFAPKIAQGIGEAGLYGGTMIGAYGRFGKPQLVEFRRVHNQVQLLARNTEFVAPDNTPEGRAVAAAYSPSLIGSTPVASQPHPERKTVLVEANPIFLTDLLGLGLGLQRSYRQNYGLDRTNSAITKVRNADGALVLEVQAHFAAASLAQPAPGAAGPVPTMPIAVPDARSLFLGLHYSLSRLPAQPMAPRPADPRVGHFVTVVQNLGDDIERSPKQYFVNRWRLEKVDPAAALSPPVKPITFWLDRTVPLKYRAAITAGILEWNKAFERIGYQNAIVVKQQPDDAGFDTLDVNVASVRWMSNPVPSFAAIGPRQVDPRSGEILDADIAMEGLAFRGQRTYRSQVIGGNVSGASGAAGSDWAALMQFGRGAQAAPAADQCEVADQAAEQLHYALDILQARGDVDPDSPEAQQWVQDYLTAVTIHEVGHTLGLRHNFRSSRIYSEQQLSDAAFTRSHGVAGSVMDYTPANLPAPGHHGGLPWQLVLGPYDYWAIEYAYKPLAAGATPAEQRAQLQAIAARSAEPELAFGTDEDNFLGIDPESLQFDLGGDPAEFARTRLAIARDLIARQEGRPLKPSDDYSVLRRSIASALRDAARAVGVLQRQVGGMRTLRDFPGSGREPLQPVPAAKQREALDVLATGLLSAQGLKLSPSLQRRLAPDYSERGDALLRGNGEAATEFSLDGVLLDLQRALLGHLMSDGVARRILDGEAKADRGGDAFHLTELYGRITRELWGELGKGREIAPLRRELQREHVNLLALQLQRPGAMSRADARSLLRQQARELQGRIEGALRTKGMDAATRAHLQDSADSLQRAMAASLLRLGA